MDDVKQYQFRTEASGELAGGIDDAITRGHQVQRTQNPFDCQIGIAGRIFQMRARQNGTGAPMEEGGGSGAEQYSLKAAEAVRGNDHEVGLLLRRDGQNSTCWCAANYPSLHLGAGQLA